MRVWRGLEPIKVFRLQGLVLAVAGCVAGCGGVGKPAPPHHSEALPRAVAQAMEVGSPTDPRIVTGGNQLGMNLLRLIAGGTSNVALSPTSIALALQLLYSGAAGPAQAAVAQTLQLGSLTPDQVNSASAALQASLDSLNADVQLTLATSLWAHGGQRLEPAFVQRDETYYGAALGNLDGLPGTRLGDPRAWVSAETPGSSLPPVPVPQAGFRLVSAMSFKGAWARPFSDVETDAFTLADGSQVASAMMIQEGQYAYHRGIDFQSVSLPYAQGRASMLIVLPDPGVSLIALLASLSAQDLDSILAQQASTAARVSLPRFTARLERSLVPQLTALGMGAAFGGDFSALRAGATLSGVQHAAFIQVNEQGTLVTQRACCSRSPVVQPAVTLAINRPFFYAIRDRDTGALLVVGAVFDPTSS